MCAPEDGNLSSHFPVAPHLEQTLSAAATVRLGAGLSAGINRPEEIAVKLMSLLGSEDQAEAARRFAGRCNGFDPRRQVGNALQAIEQLLGWSGRRSAGDDLEPISEPRIGMAGAGGAPVAYKAFSERAY